MTATGAAEVPEELAAAAAASQASLATKLAMLRELAESFPDTVGPAAADRWIHGRAPAQAQARPGSVNRGQQRSSPDTEPSQPGGESISLSASAPPSPRPVRESNPPSRDPADRDPAELSATALLDGYRRGAFSPTEAIEACLARIDTQSSSIGNIISNVIGAVVSRNDAAAREQAAHSTQRWRDGDPRPLEGVPVGIKDIIETRGLLTEAGSPLFAGHMPVTDATVVARLRDAGAVILAKTTTPEFAFGDETGDGVVNPSAAGRWAGGSSSGSAAGLAAGFFPLALGTDTGGSIRVPASYCGVAGLKPTFGRVPRDGVFGVSWTLDHAGPMTRTVEDLGLMLGVIAGGCDRDPYSATRPVPDYSMLGGSLAGQRVGVVEGWLAEGNSPAVAAAVATTLDRLEDLGCRVEPVPFASAELAGIVAWVITVVEFAAHHVSNLHRIGEFTPSAAQRLAAGVRTSAAEYLQALRARSQVQADLDAAFEKVDVLVTAATPTTAPDPTTFFDDGDRLWLDKVARNFLPFNVTGNPALVLPVALDEGRPAAVQIVAPTHADALCLQVGAALQRAAPVQAD